MSEIFKTKPLPVKPTIFIGQILWSATVARLIHFNTVGYAEHKNAESLEGSLRDLVDGLTETYFGEIGKREQIKVPAAEYIHFPAHIKQMMSYVESNRDAFPASDMQNIVDEIMSAYKKALYLTTLS